jgi:hypothetical protein
MISLYFSIASGVLLTISEILPYISEIKSNGITQFLINKILQNKPKNDNTHTNDDKLDNILEKLDELVQRKVSVLDIDDKHITIEIL